MTILSFIDYQENDHFIFLLRANTCLKHACTCMCICICMCMCMYVCMYQGFCVCMYVCMYKSICIYVCTYMHILVVICLCVHSRTRVYILACRRVTYIHTSITHIHIPACIHAGAYRENDLYYTL